MRITKRIAKATIVLMAIVLALFMFAVPAFAGTGYSGPTPPTIGDPALASQNEIQWLRINWANGGAFRFKYTPPSPGVAVYSADVLYSATAADVETAIESFAAIGPNVTVTGGGFNAPTQGTVAYGNPFVIEYGGPYAGLDIFKAGSAITGTLSVSFTASNNVNPDCSLATANAPCLVGTEWDNTVGSPTYGEFKPAVSLSTRVNGYTSAAGASTSPHGGFSSSTDFCQQCHSVHNTTNTSDGQYALLWKPTVTQTCQTCHATLGITPGTPTGRRDSNALIGDPDADANPGNGFQSLTMGTVSVRTAYDTPVASRLSIHPLDSTANTNGTGDNVQMLDSGWEYGGFNAANWSTARAVDVLTCTSCHSPHGDFGQLVNSPRGVVRTGALQDGTGDYENQNTAQLNAPMTFVEGRAFFFGTNPIDNEPWVQYLHLDASPAGVWEACPGPVLNGNPVTTGTTRVTTVANAPDTVPESATLGPCQYLQINDADGTLSSLVGYKLLTAYPDHSYTTVLDSSGAHNVIAPSPTLGGGESWGMDARSHDQARWCGTCHVRHVATNWGTAFTYHNHPTGCSSCHGNPTIGTPTSSQSRDFPHTSTLSDFLTSYPDGLCVGRCHTAGSLP